ncbi:hypothetical protein K6119_04850 [Paracrocinitomix mangrovi]|uniref:hypothetical protein n=1 Tax=Paracrocinitomix mangrovi TaxID=2862509 RepID=UPI001C8D7CEE|nr:hypothetical protein [Paracrocinitomix mangrovi]UKN02843.1 hypothetical protein K6119_04850 [Paracrocinitomix mangrovi]
MGKTEDRQNLLNLLSKKSAHKQDVYNNTIKWFAELKTVLEKGIEELGKNIPDKRVRFRYEDHGDTEARLYLGSDVLVFHMHTNVFKLSDDDYSSQTSYVKQNPDNAYCGIINVYDFLADSYEYNRWNDLGYMICRIFINKEDHFKVQGKGNLGLLYRNFMQQTIDAEILEDLVYQIGIFALDFDLLIPPYKAVNIVSVNELLEISSNSKLKTGKRLGFKFQSDHNIGD